MSTKKTSKSDSQTTKKKASSSKVSSQVNDFDVCDYDHQTTKILQRFITGTVHEVQYPLQTIAKRMEKKKKKYKDRDFEYI
ncbi:MAG: hypothetical protein KC618_07970, partial [Candidatus Omnitrophica bacterium]|nr:hypothetical protein [Candidatus Omnitrophota bacterium]